MHDNAPSKHAKISTSVRPRGGAIRQVRLSQGFTQEALLEECRALNAHFSIQSLRRAERRERVARTTVEGIARALGVKAEDLIELEAEDLHSDFWDFTGDWLAISIEDDRLTRAYILEEDMVISRDEAGRYHVENNSTQFPRTETTQNVIQIEDMLMGQSFIDGWVPPNGTGTFQLQILRENTYLEGYVSFYDADSKRIEMSRLLAVRKGIPDYEMCLDAARAKMQRELERYDNRI